MLGVAAQQGSGDALEAPLVHVQRGRHAGKMLGKVRVLHPVDEQVALDRGVLVDRQGRIEGKAIIAGGRLEDLDVVLDVKVIPAGHSVVEDRALRVDQPLHVDHLNGAQPGAGGAGPGGFIERKMGHTQHRDRRPAVRAG